MASTVQVRLHAKCKDLLTGQLTGCSNRQQTVALLQTRMVKVKGRKTTLNETATHVQYVDIARGIVPRVRDAPHMTVGGVAGPAAGGAEACE